MVSRTWGAAVFNESASTFPSCRPSENESATSFKPEADFPAHTPKQVAHKGKIAACSAHQYPLREALASPVRRREVRPPRARQSLPSPARRGPSSALRGEQGAWASAGGGGWRGGKGRQAESGASGRLAEAEGRMPPPPRERRSRAAAE